MSEYYDCEIKAGYYNILGARVAEHTFVIAEKGGVQYAFPCFGCFALTNGERGQTGVVYPAELWSPWMIGSRPQGKTLRANLYVAFGMARWTAQPSYDYKVQDWDTWWNQQPPEIRYLSPTCNAGITYAITGVCQQACNRILWSSRQGDFTYTPVNWPPSFSKSYWVWGYYGKLTESNAINFAVDLIQRAKQAGQVSFEAGSEDMRALEKVSAKAWNASLRQTRKALTAKTPPGSRLRRQEVKKMIEMAPGGDHVVASRKLSGMLAPDEKFHRLKAELDKQLVRGEVSHDEYANRVNSEFRKMVEEFQNVLPPETFKAMFRDDDAGDIIIRSQMPKSYESIQEAIRI